MGAWTNHQFSSSPTHPNIHNPQISSNQLPFQPGLVCSAFLNPVQNPYRINLRCIFLQVYHKIVNQMKANIYHGIHGSYGKKKVGKFQPRESYLFWDTCNSLVARRYHDSYHRLLMPSLPVQARDRWFRHRAGLVPQKMMIVNGICYVQLYIQEIQEYIYIYTLGTKQPQNHVGHDLFQQ